MDIKYVIITYLNIKHIAYTHALNLVLDDK